MSEKPTKAWGLFVMAERFRIGGRNWKNWLQVKPSMIPGAGRGLFARQDIPAKTVLGSYHGHRLTTLRGVYGLKDDRFVYVMSQPDGQPLWIDGNVPSNYLRFINGTKTRAELKSVNVNAYQYAGVLKFRATRPIIAGEELILDYGEGFWDTYFNADGIKHRNDRLLDRIDKELHDCSDIRVRAALRGMKWLLDQMSSKRAYFGFFVDYLWIFYEIKVTGCNPVIVDIATRVLELELDGAQFQLRKIFKSNLYDKWRFIDLIPILFEVQEIDIQRYAQFYRSFFPRTFKYYDLSLYDYIQQDDFEGVVDVLMDSCFLEMAHRASRNSRLFRLPKSRFSKYWRAVKQYDIRALEASVRTDYDQQKLDYQITHLVMCRFAYGSFVLAPESKFDTQILDYLVRNESRILEESEDLDLIAELVYCYAEMKTRKFWIRKVIKRLIAAQNADGSWGTEDELRSRDMYNRVHATWTVVNGLCHAMRQDR